MTPRQRFLAARLAYVGVVMLATLSDLHPSGDLAAAGQRLARAFDPSFGWRDVIDGLRNVALFAGLGAVWVVTSFTGRVRREVVVATVVGCVLSATVEGAQVFSPVRTASIVDLTTNTVGALVGAAVTAFLVFEVQRSRGARSYLGLPATLLAGAYGCAVLAEALVPLFGSGPLPGVEGGPMASIRIALGAAKVAPGPEQLFDALLFAPATFLAVMALAERGTRVERAWPRVALAGVVLAFGAEIAHGAARVPISWGAAALHAAALAAGAWAAGRWLAALSRTMRGAARAAAAFLVYAALLVLWGWRPLMPELDPGAIAAQLTVDHLVPLKALAGEQDVFSALHVAQQFLLYLPLGALLAVWPLRLAGRWAHLWPAVWLAAAVEAGHVVIADRFFDVTNAILALSGLAIGWVVVRRSGFRPYGEAWPASAPAAARGPRA
ncbi:MAG TPA: VanZ family protein [Gemmatimonadales bacterium]|nr:VanZ family protein [Gemmatimonadales bacterium]